MSAPRVLIAYASKNGGTAGIAQTIADTLRGHGLVADVRSARHPGDLDDYDAVILGGALYMGRWHRHARSFARHYATRLSDRPVWLFSSGPLDGSADEHDIPPVRSAARAMEFLHARGHATFGGCLTPDAKGFIAKQMAKTKFGDYRNTERIVAWADAIAAELACLAPQGAVAAS